MEWLKTILDTVEGLEDEAKTKIVESFNKEFPKHAVPKEQYSKKTAELDEVNGKLEEATNKMDELSKSSGASEELKKQLEDTKAEFENYKNEIATKETNSNKRKALIDKLVAEGALKSGATLMANGYDIEKIQLDSKGNLVDADVHVNGMKEVYADQFGKVDVDSHKPKEGQPQDDPNSMDDQAFFNARMKK